jgi:xylitol oxidase
MNTTKAHQNWAGNQTYSAQRLYIPETLEQLQNLLHQSEKVKILGSRHSFNLIADSTGNLVSLEKFNRVLELNHQTQTVTIEGGIRYGELSQFLYKEGYSIHNLASLPHISVAGACASATHGSGDLHGNLATAVAALEIVKADGEIITLSRDQHSREFDGAVVGLGGLGAVTKLTLDISPSFEVAQYVYENLPLAPLETEFDNIMSSAYSVSLFTDWKSPQFNQVWFKRRVGDKVVEPELFGATSARKNLHPLAGCSAINCTQQMGVPGPWHERLPHFRLNFTPSSGEELQSEYLVPRQHAFAALNALSKLSDKIAPLLQICEIRTIMADNLWMSPCYKQPCVGIHFTWLKKWEEVKALLPLIEAEIRSFEARPHWGKLFTMAPSQIQSLYEKLPDFQRLLTSYDPQGAFRNEYLNRYVFSE